jgi:UDP-2,4-diacetamido-2,4,6-trideoxy-beta-L-altropyranose hydrolase
MKATGEFSFRVARREDAYVLWLWANDPLTRQAALNSNTIAWDEHRAWLAQKLASTSARVWIAVDETDRPLGCIRFDTTDDWESAKLSYTVAPDARGHGFGRRIVEAGVARIRSEHPAVRMLAEVRMANIPSLRIFRGLSWREAAPREEVVRFSWIGESE